MSSADELLARGLASLGISDPRIADQLLRFAELVLIANRSTNLTGAKDLTSLVREHILDSLAPLRAVPLNSPIVDVGSGAGFPGIPGAIVYANQSFVLLEPRAKRAQFLDEAIHSLGLPNARVVKSSAHGPGAESLAETAGTVLMRAVAGPEKALPLGLGLLRPAGRLVLYQGRSGSPTPAQRAIARRYGGAEISPKRIDVPTLDAVRNIWVIKKAKAHPRCP